eukprot:12043800-Alexandrium_andersonii.AAC.1
MASSGASSGSSRWTGPTVPLWRTRRTSGFRRSAASGCLHSGPMEHTAAASRMARRQPDTGT